MDPVERNALHAIPVIDSADIISTLPNELFIAHILPHLNEEEFSKARLVSRHWSDITEGFRTSLVHRARRGNPMTTDQWLILSKKNKDLAILVTTLYSFIKKFTRHNPANGVPLKTDSLEANVLLEQVSEGGKLSPEDLNLLRQFSNSISCYCLNEISGIQDWQEPFFEELLSDSLCMMDLLSVHVKLSLMERLGNADDMADLKARLMQDIHTRDGDAQMIYAYLSEKGCEELGIEKNLSEAVEYYKQAASNDCETAKYYLGCCYMKGHLVQQNNETAISYFQLVAKQTQMTFFASLANHTLGYCHAKGLCGAPNPEKAFACMQISANKASSLAQLYLGFCYASGYGVKQDWEEAFASYASAIGSGHDMFAFYSLGFCFLSGQGVQQNYQQAAKCFLKAWHLCEDLRAFINLWVDNEELAEAV